MCETIILCRIDFSKYMDKIKEIFQDNTILEKVNIFEIIFTNFYDYTAFGLAQLYMEMVGYDWTYIDRQDKDLEMVIIEMIDYFDSVIETAIKNNGDYGALDGFSTEYDNKENYYVHNFKIRIY